ncbi:MAG: sulfite exporter TauE/SafE family protein [Acidobacteriaceae bacterium]
MKKTIIDIQGMHCRSCELLIEGNLKKIEGVEKVSVSAATGKAKIWVSRSLSQNELAKAVEEAGYMLGKESKSLLSHNPRTYWNLFFAGVVVMLGYLAIRLMGFENLPAKLTQQSIVAAPITGLVAGVSSCMALIGGLVLAVSANHSKLHPEASALEKFKPHLFFNLGRVLGFGLLGGLVGLLGASLQPSIKLLSALTLAIGVLMVLLGLKLTEVFPFLDRINLTLPKFFGKKSLAIDKGYSNLGTFGGGAMTFFLPCGFTQAMQLFALSTGSFVKGGLIMSLFALGTTPGLLGIGGLSSIFKAQKAKIFFAIAGLAVVFFGGANITNAKRILFPRIILPQAVNFRSGPAVDPEVAFTGDPSAALELKTTYRLGKDIDPNKFTVKVGQPIRFTVDSKDQGIGCMSTIMIPGLYNQPLLLEKNKTLTMEFTPKKKGDYPITCAMGVKRGTLTVE